MSNMTLIIVVSLIILSLLFATLNFIQRRKRKKYKTVINNLEVEKNMLDSTAIEPELSKIETYLKNEKLEVMYNDWQERLQGIKDKKIPKITDMLIEAEYSLSKKDYKSTMYKIAKLEMEIYKVRTTSEFLLNEIKEITTSEERNRAIITKQKTKYRTLIEKFTSIKPEFGITIAPITVQFQTISKRFEVFESKMEHNEYTEVAEIINSIDELLNHLEVVIEECPHIILLATSILPKKISEVNNIYQQMHKAGYPLDYLSVDSNVKEAETKIKDILERVKVLNIEDSLLELKVLDDYFENLFNDFEREKINGEEFNNAFTTLKMKLEKTNTLVADIFEQLEAVKNLYDLSKHDIEILNNVKNELEKLNKDYDLLVQQINKHSTAFSQLTEEVERLVSNLSLIDDKLDNSLDALGSMREDELRARQQLEEIKVVLKNAKNKIKDYNLPVIPDFYYVQLGEASEAIKEIIKELDKKPITISVLNTRVDTARDLAIKLFSKTKDMMKTAMFAELAIVYGNRYRSSVPDLNKHLLYSENLFFKGDYKKSLELSINVLNRVEPGIYNKLSHYYEK